MAAQNLSVFSRPQFPQVFARAINSLVTRQLGLCSFESGESSYGACDSVPCTHEATVLHLESDREFCFRHFVEASRG